MKKFIYIFTLFTSIAFGQVGINILTPDVSAMLDLNSNNKGIYIPQINLTVLNDNTTPINSPATGLMIYNNGTIYPKGIYYWNGTQWLKLHNTGDFNEVYSIAASITNSLVTNTNSGTGTSGTFMAYTEQTSNTISGNIPASYDNTNGNITLPKGKYYVSVKLDGTISNREATPLYSTTNTLETSIINNYALDCLFVDGSNNSITDPQTVSNLGTGAIVGYEYSFWLDLTGTSNIVRLKLYNNPTASSRPTTTTTTVNTSQSGLKVSFTRML